MTGILLKLLVIFLNAYYYESNSIETKNKKIKSNILVRTKNLVPIFCEPGTKL